MMVTAEERKDAIDRFVEGAVEQFPTLDPEVEAAVDRMHKITKYLERSTERTVKVLGLNAGEFKVLLKLREAPEKTMTAGAIADRLDLSSSAMTNRLDRLETDGHVIRERDTEDRRSVLVRITPRGEDILGQAVEQQGKKESSLLSILSGDEQRQLNGLLRAMVLEIEDRGELDWFHQPEAAQIEA
jgi:DNA-binding MarR family transcriptional regulator